MKFFRSSIILSTAFLVACAANSSGITVSKVLMAGQLNSKGEIETEQTSFAPTQVAIYAHAFIEGHTESTIVRGEWWFDGGKEPKKIYEATVTVLPDRPVAMFTLQSTQQWPVGDYRFVMYYVQEQLSETKFSVK